MRIDISKLECVKHHGTDIIARCPACAEQKNDRAGEHLFISQTGAYGCVVNPGEQGHTHRQRIFELVGIREQRKLEFTIRKTEVPPIKVVQKDILGHLGRQNLSHAGKYNGSPNQENICKDLKDAVPTVPQENLTDQSVANVSLTAEGIPDDNPADPRVTKILKGFEGRIVLPEILEKIRSYRQEIQKDKEPDKETDKPVEKAV